MMLFQILVLYGYLIYSSYIKSTEADGDAQSWRRQVRTGLPQSRNGESFAADRADRDGYHNYLISLPPNTKDKRVKGLIMDPIHIFTVFAIVLAVGIIAQMASRLTRMPSIVFLLAAGILLGPECAGLIDPWLYGDGLNLIITFAVVMYSAAAST
jgi:hypothetical protein